MHDGSPSTPKPARADGVLLGIFVGGRGRRMGGRDKSALPAPGGGSLLQRQLGLAAQLGWEAVVVGTPPGVHAGADQPDADQPGAGPAEPPVARLADEPAGVGPLGGLGPLLRAAGRRDVIALACDLPYVEAQLLRRLALHPADAAVVAPRLQDDFWMPLCARYRPAAVLPVLPRILAGDRRSFQALLRALDVAPIELTAAERGQLRDWDTPQDMIG